jgi:predicted trehalose synthase
MASDPVVEYWAELMGRTPFTPDVMAQWKRVMDHGLEAWSRALAEVMATEDFAQLLGTSIEQWISAQASLSGKAMPLAGQADQLALLVAEARRLGERLRQVEERLAGPPESTASASGETSRRRRRRRAAQASPPERRGR